jgi:hypothetical protein
LDHGHGRVLSAVTVSVNVSNPNLRTIEKCGAPRQRGAAATRAT